MKKIIQLKPKQDSEDEQLRKQQLKNALEEQKKLQELLKK